MLRQEEGVVVDVVDHSGSLGVYRREEGEETVNIKQTVARQAKAALGVI